MVPMTSPETCNLSLASARLSGVESSVRLMPFGMRSKREDGTPSNFRISRYTRGLTARTRSVGPRQEKIPHPAVKFDPDIGIMH